jgi:hypothetical protein
MMGEALTDDERALFTKLTKREREPLQRVEEFAAVVGRRGGKSRAMAILACYIAGLCKHPLVRGETGILLCCAPDQRQAKILLEYCRATLEASAMLRSLVKNCIADEIELAGGVAIEVRSAHFRRLRGPSYIGIIVDESAFLMTDESYANPDSEILSALRPGLSTTGGPLILASSPYSKRGELWTIYKDHFGPDGDPRILVAQGASRDFNVSLSQSVVDRAYQRDAAAANAEYGGCFRNDISAFLSLDLIESRVDRGITVRPPRSDVSYIGWADPSGGVHDSFTLGISHNEDGIAVLDCLVEIRAPFSPSVATEQIAATCKAYNLTEVGGDKYSAQWCVEAFAKNGISYKHSERDRSAIYLETIPLLSGGTSRLLDNKRLIAQLAGLERRSSPVGKDRIDHGVHGMDDVAVSACGSLVGAVCDPLRVWQLLGEQCS